MIEFIINCLKGILLISIFYWSIHLILYRKDEDPYPDSLFFKTWMITYFTLRFGDIVQSLVIMAIGLEVIKIEKLIFKLLTRKIKKILEGERK